MGNTQRMNQRTFGISDDVSEEYTSSHEHFDGGGDSSQFTYTDSIKYGCCWGLVKIRKKQCSPVEQTSNANQWPKTLNVSNCEESLGIVQTRKSLPPEKSHGPRVCYLKSNASNAEEVNEETEICDREKLKEMLHKEKGKHDVPMTYENAENHARNLDHLRKSIAYPLKPQNSLSFYTTVPASVFDHLLSLQHARRIGATRCHDRRMRIVETSSGCSLSLSPIPSNDKTIPLTVPENHGVLRVKIVGRHKDNVLRALCELNSRMPELMRNAASPKDASPVFTYVINNGCLSLTEQVAIQFPEILSRSSTWLKPNKRKDQFSQRLLVEDCRRRIEKR